MFCGDPVGEQETATLKVLGESANFALSGNALTLTSGDGASMIVLEQK
jgi:heat shock protein HslJ